MRLVMRIELFSAAAGISIVAFSVFCNPGHAQQASAQAMWGTTASGGPGSGGLEGAVSHLTNGSSAGQVQAAKKDWLLGPNITVNAIGVQNIISVDGDNNNIAADQTGTNSGTITNSGRVTSGR